MRKQTYKTSIGLPRNNWRQTKKKDKILTNINKALHRKLKIAKLQFRRKTCIEEKHDFSLHMNGILSLLSDG
jgi:hypothetical protein